MAIFNSYVSLPEGTDSVFISVIKFSRIFSKVRVPKWLSHSFDFGVGHETNWDKAPNFDPKSRGQLTILDVENPWINTVNTGNMIYHG